MLRKHLKVEVDGRCLPSQGRGRGARGAVPNPHGARFACEPREVSLHPLQGRGIRDPLFLFSESTLRALPPLSGGGGREGGPQEQPSADSAPTFCARLRGPQCLKLSRGRLFLILQKEKVKLVNGSKVFSFKNVLKTWASGNRLFILGTELNMFADFRQNYASHDANVLSGCFVHP